MAYYIKKNGELEKIAGNVALAQADWNETDDRKITKIKNQPETLKTLDAIVENSNENALVGANALKELTTTVAGMGSELIKTSAKVNLLANSDLGINVVEKGEHIHLDDSADSKLVEFSLYGKAVQNTTSGKQLIPYPYQQGSSGIVTVLENGGIKISGTTTNDVWFAILNSASNINPYYLPSGTYTLSVEATAPMDYIHIGIINVSDGSTIVSRALSGLITEVTFTIDSETNISIRIFVGTGKTVNTTIYPMLRLASITDNTWEPYTGGIPSPNPEYPQEIEVSGESYNLIPYPYEITTMTVNGITWTDLGDGRIMANGTATETSSFDKFLGNQTEGLREMLQSYGEVILTGCPSGGGSSTFRLFVWGAYNKGEYSANDYGSGATFTFDNDDKGFGFSTQIMKGVKVENLVFKPMLRKASVKNDRYMPYGKGSVEVKSVGKNLLPYPYYETTHEESGVTYTDKGNGEISVNGTNTNTGGYSTFQLIVGASFFNELQDGNYILSGCPIGGKADTYRVMLTIQQNGTWNTGCIDYGSGGTFTISQEEVSKWQNAIINIRVYGTANNLTFKPMIRLASDTDSTYETYKETVSTIPTPNGLAGIPVASGGNYTDSNGQQWICDEIVKYADGSGEYVKRIKKIVVDGVNRKCNYVNASLAGKEETLVQINFGVNADFKDSYLQALEVLLDRGIYFKYGGASSCFRYGLRRDGNTGVCCYYIGTDSGVTDVSTANEWLKNNPITLYYAVNPITTPLTEEQLSELLKLKTFYPVTNISNDFDCGMKVKYIADSKAYVDKNLALQAQAQEESMMSMFMLLPDAVQAAMIEKDTNNLLMESEV